MTSESAQIIAIVEQLPQWERERLVSAVWQIAEVYAAGRHAVLRCAALAPEGKSPENVVPFRRRVRKAL